MSSEKQLFSTEAQQAIPWMVISKCLLFIIYFSISVISVRYLGTEQYGVFVICRSIADVLILICTLGMTAAYIRFIPELVLDKNLVGIKRLISKAFALQALAIALVSLGLYLSQHHIEQYFEVAFNGALLLTLILVICEQFKTNINSILTALYQTKRLAIFSFFNGIIWLACLIIFLEQQAGVSSVLSAQSVSYALIYALAACILYRYFNSLNWRSPDRSIGYKRVLNHSGSIALSTIVRLLMLKYTELFFLGGMTDAETVGLYDLAFSLPMMVIVFIPSAIHELFVSGFSEAYVKKPDCLPSLIKALYKALIIITLPIAIFGFMFSGELLIYCYGIEAMPVFELTMAFCLLHILPLISTPLSVGIQVREKVINMFPTLLLQLTVNIVLDYILIVHMNLGMWGAILALFLTFLVTIPIRLYLVKRILGGIYFPGTFFLRIVFATLLSAYLIKVSLDPKTLFTIAIAFIFFVICTVLVIKVFRLVEDSDIEDMDIFLCGAVGKCSRKIAALVANKSLMQSREIRPYQTLE